MQKAYNYAMNLREHCPRYGALNEVPAEAAALADLIPPFAHRLYRSFAEKGFSDPASIGADFNLWN